MADLYATFMGPFHDYVAPICPSCGDEVDAPGDRCGRERCEDHVTQVYSVPWGYQARCACGWKGVLRASDTALRDAKREGDEHQRVPVPESADE